MNDEIKVILNYLDIYKDLDKKILLDYITNLQQRIEKAIEYIEKDTRWFDSDYARIYGELCSCEGANSNRLEVMINPSNLLKNFRRR